MGNDLVFCNDVNELTKALGKDTNLMNVFINSSNLGLKAVVLYYGKIYPGQLHGNKSSLRK
jgi:hypothetical protein